MHYIRKLISEETADVVELGCGTGSLITSLAREHQNSSIRFHASDVSPGARRCAAHLGEMAQLRHFQVHDLDISSSNLEFISPTSNVLLFCSGLLCLFDALPEKFASELQRLRRYRLVAFEPISDQFTHEKGRSLIWKNLTASRGLPSGLWQDIQSRASRNELVIEAIIADFAGPTPFYPMSLLQLSSASSA